MSSLTHLPRRCLSQMRMIGAGALTRGSPQSHPLVVYADVAVLMPEKYRVNDRAGGQADAMELRRIPAWNDEDNEDTIFAVLLSSIAFTSMAYLLSPIMPNHLCFRK
mmetsp:Transcript_17588/g.44243  ORF Transcript_17588/g.44243 Transcript_17588/m.44243 type:complete len:107 (-) Transcript_17588:123-443(-)